MSPIHNRLSIGKFFNNRLFIWSGPAVFVNETDRIVILISVGETSTSGVSSMTELRIISIEASTVSLSVVETLKSWD
jgi:hypothetical protein